MIRRGLLGTLPIVAFLFTGATGCSLIPVTIKTSSTLPRSDGTVEHKESSWTGTLDQVPAHVSEAGGQLAEVTGELVKCLTEVPPPGKVTLKELGVGLGQFDGDAHYDFLAKAKGPDGKPIGFQYVQLGVPSFDRFFKDAQVAYALLYQADKTVHRMAELAGTLLHQKIDVGVELNTVVSRALEVRASAEATPIIDELRQMKVLAMTLGPLVGQFVARITTLVADGQQLITAAPTSLTNPKVVAHLDLVKDGLLASVTVVKNSAELLISLSGNLAGFAG